MRPATDRSACRDIRAIRPRRIFRMRSVLIPMPNGSRPFRQTPSRRSICMSRSAGLMCWYCGCHTSVVRRDEPIAVYASALRCEIDQVTEQIDRRLKVDHVHFGGGTPTIMAPETFADLIGSIRHSFFIRPSAEIAVEIDPRTLSQEMIEALAFSGVSRASLGVQSFDPAVQRAINRVQSFEVTASATEGLRRAGIAGINFDLIYGLPHQTVASCLDTVDAVRRTAARTASRCSAMPTSRRSRNTSARSEEASLPDSLERHRQSEAIARALTRGRLCADRPRSLRASGRRHGARRCATARCGGISRATRRMPGNILLGFGASAIGRLPQGYVQNEVGTRAYSQSIAERPAGDGQGLRPDRRRPAARRDHRAHHVRLRRRSRTDLRAARIGTRSHAEISASPAGSDCRRRCRTDGTSLAVTDRSRFLVRSVAAAFDAHLDGSSSSTAARSRSSSQ